MKLTFHFPTDILTINLDKEKGEWFVKELENLKPSAENLLTFAQLKARYEEEFDDFELFWYSKPINQLKENGLLAI